MPISQDLQRLMHNRWAVAGLVGAAGLGVVVLMRRRTAKGSGTTDTTSGQATTNGVATLDTSGTDIANWLGQYQASLQSTLDQYAQSLTGAVTALQNMQTNGSASPHPIEHAPIRYYQPPGTVRKRRGGDPVPVRRRGAP